ncbi:nicotinamide N-methyltransferase-like [Gastrophryne carolinensis]
MDIVTIALIRKKIYRIAANVQQKLHVPKYAVVSQLNRIIIPMITVLRAAPSFVLKELLSLNDTSDIRGEVLIDMSVGPLLFGIIPMCESFSEVIMLDLSDSALKGIEAWRKKEEGATDWSFASQYMKEQNISREQWKEKEEALRSKISRVSQVSFSKDRPSDLSSLPKADCVLCLYMLHPVSEDYDAFCCNVQRLASLLKPGGVLLLLGSEHASFYKLGEDRYFLLDITKEQLTKAVEGAGLTIQAQETLKNEAANDHSKYDTLEFVKAVKEC